MISTDVLNRLQLLIRTSAPPLVDVAQTPMEEVPWVPGQPVKAMVLDRLANGRFQVQLGDLVLEMNVPHNPRPGTQLLLTFVSRQPRLSFALARDIPVAPGNDHPAGARPQVTLSESARLLGTLLEKISIQADAQSKAAEKPPSLVKAGPLLSAPPSDIGEFVASLRSALAQSGWFYESHQAQWVAGERTLAELLQEPQARLPARTSAPAARVVRTDAPVAPQPHAGVARRVAEHTNATVAPPVAAQPNAAVAPDGGVRNIARKTGLMSALVVGDQPGAGERAGATRSPVHDQTVAVVQQQLQMLDSRQLVWQGQVWPGQFMEWQVEEQGARAGATDDAAMPHWQTTVRLQLPRLGAVRAALVFGSGSLRIALEAADPGTAEALRAEQDPLRSAMAACGLSVLAMSVAQHEQA